MRLGKTRRKTAQPRLAQFHDLTSFLNLSLLQTHLDFGAGADITLRIVWGHCGTEYCSRNPGITPLLNEKPLRRGFSSEKDLLY